ncbi:MAG: DUF4118 domain-containing protein [Bryobacteraceae bacterium]|nr:DUF4118 domain-containing protein [Bryobacteraceae bacterium]
MMPRLLRKPFPFGGLGFGMLGVAAVTVVLRQAVAANATTAGFLYLLVVLGVATRSGFRASALVSVAAMLCYNFFFLPPVGRFTIADPENWVALFTFLLTALVASHLSDRAQKQAAEAKRRQQETEQLYSLSRAILLTEAERPVGTQAAQSIAQIFQLPAVVLLDARTGLVFRGGERDVEGLESRLEATVRLGSHERDDGRDLDIWPIALGGSPMGALAAVGMRVSDGAVQSMLNLVAIALERVRMEESASRAEVARQSEEFKSTLLDAIAHEFKTPLTSLKAAASGMRGLGGPLWPEQEELTAIIEEETDRLSQLVTEAVKMSEIDAGKVKLDRRRVEVSALLSEVKDSFEGRGAERIRVEAGEGAALEVDRELMGLAIRQVVDNALKYTAASKPVVCGVDREQGCTRVRVDDEGPGIPERERERVFDKFYRRPGTRDRVPGSGLGLHIAREITRMHGGDLRVEPKDGTGTRFSFEFPASEFPAVEHGR